MATDYETNAIEKIIHQPCADCGSSDALSYYLNDTAKWGLIWASSCFSCEKQRLQKDFTEVFYDEVLAALGHQVGPIKTQEEDESGVKVGGEQEEVSELPEDFTPVFGGRFNDFYRGISEKTREYYGTELSVDPSNDESITEIFNYFLPNGDFTGQKTRNKFNDKRFNTGKISNDCFWGQHLFPPNPRRKLLVVEGEVDAMSAYQMLGGSVSVVSLPNGASAAKKNFRKQLDYIGQFEEVVICFDPDEAGESALRSVLEYADYNRWKTMTLSQTIGDVNEYLIKGYEKEFKNLFWNAKLYRPEDVLTGEDFLKAGLKETDKDRVSYPWPTLQEKTYGWGRGEVVGWTAQTGQGKSQILKVIIKHLIQNSEEKIGIIALEESTETTAKDLVGLFMGKRLRLPITEWTEEEYWATANKYKIGERVVRLEGSGSQDLEYLERKVRELVFQFGCTTIFLDHISMVTSDQRYDDERQALDKIATRLVQLAHDTKIRLAIVAHLNRSNEIRGTGNIEKLLHLYINIERDKEHENPRMRNISQLIVRKNRFNGDTGPAGYIEFNPITADMAEVMDIDVEEMEGKKKEGYKRAA